jgi:hypothetical protein
MSRQENEYRLSVKFQWNDETGAKWFLVHLPSRAGAKRAVDPQTGKNGWSGPALEQKIPSNAFSSEKDFLNAIALAAGAMAIAHNGAKYLNAFTQDSFNPDDVMRVAHEAGKQCIAQVHSLERVALQRRAEALLHDNEVKVEVERVEE